MGAFVMCVTSDADAPLLRRKPQLPRWREGDGMGKLLASLTVAAGMALAAVV